MFKSTIFSISLSSCFSERFFCFICLKRLLVRDVLYGEQLALCNALPPPSQSSVPGAVTHAQGGAPTSSLPAPGPEALEQQPLAEWLWIWYGPAVSVCAEAVSSAVFMGGCVCLLPPKHSKTTTLVNFLEINYFEGYYLNKRDKILPNN